MVRLHWNYVTEYEIYYTCTWIMVHFPLQTSRILHQKPNVAQLITIFSVLLITKNHHCVTRSCHCSKHWSIWTQFAYSWTASLRSTLILSSHTHLPQSSGNASQPFQIQVCIRRHTIQACHVFCPYFTSWFVRHNNNNNNNNPGRVNLWKFSRFTYQAFPLQAPL